MRIENIILNCMQEIHNSYFINEMADLQTIQVKREQEILYNEYILLRKMLVFYTGIPYTIKNYGDRLDIMYFEKNAVIKELNRK